MIVDSGHINCAMSQSEVRELHKSVLSCHLLSAYNWYILSAIKLIVFFQLYSRKNRFITSDDNVLHRLT